MRRDNYLNHLIVVFYDKAEMPQDELIKNIYSYATSDFRLKKIVEKYNATEEDFNEIFNKLIYWANFKKGRRYVPINSFFYVSSLEKILKNKDLEAKPLTMKMMNHFHI
jgi:hypothetical protein